MNLEDQAQLTLLKGKIAELSELVDALAGSAEPASHKNLIYEERRHFEGLLKDRISIQLVFSTLLLYVVYRGVSPTSTLDIPVIGAVSLQRILLIVGAFVSAALLQAVFRTYQLTECALSDIKANWEGDPYPRYVESKRVWLWNANYSLLAASFILMLLFVFLAVWGVPESGRVV